MFLCRKLREQFHNELDNARSIEERQAIYKKYADLSSIERFFVQYIIKNYNLSKNFE